MRNTCLILVHCCMCFTVTSSCMCSTWTWRLKQKAKQSRYTPWRCLGEEELYLLLIHDLGIRWGWVVSVTPRPRFRPGERTPGTHCTGGWVSLRAGLDTEVRGKILCFCRGLNPRSPGRPVRSQTLYWLSYPARKVKEIYKNQSIRTAGEAKRPHVPSSTCADKMLALCNMQNLWWLIHSRNVYSNTNGHFTVV
jgi:hypothetical protein